MIHKYGGIQAYILRVRRRLHQIPEVGMHLPKTAAFIRQELEALDIPHTCSPTDSGIMAVIEGAYPGKTIAFRSDMDALQLEEENQVDYRSTHPGCMHACGHDAHMAMLLGTARLLATWRLAMHGSVRLIFQTGEETARGAEEAIRNGFVQDTDAIFGIHIGTLLGKEIPSGQLVAASGCCMAAYDHFILRIRGKSCHGSDPANGVDPIQIAAHVVLALQSIQTRELSGATPSVITIGKIAGGFEYNVIPDCVVIEGTTRALNEAVRQYLARRIAEITDMTARTFGGTCETEMIWGAPPVVNTREMAHLAAEAAAEVLGDERVRTEIDAPCMAGEDFANYLNHIPGAFLFLSSSNPEKGTDQPHHSSRFDIDEDVLWEGSAVFDMIARKFLMQTGV